MKRFMVMLSGLFLLVPLAQADSSREGQSQAHVFRYYDGDHKMHIEQQVTDDALTYGYDELSSQMIVLRTVAPRPTGKDLERLKLEQARRQQAEERAREDVQLRRLYSSSQDAERSRDSQIDAIQLRIDFSNNSIMRMRALRAQDAERAASFERNGKPVPKDVQDNIQRFDTQISAAQEDIKARRGEQEKVRTQFTAIVQRLHELQSGEAAATTSASGSTPAPASKP
jgi:uncharacterized protein YkuJ